MSDALQFMQAGIPRPVAALNGSAVLPALFTNIPSSSSLASGAINARVVQPGALTAATLATILNLSGKGVISFLACASVDATARTHRIKITLDGTVIFDATSASVSSLLAYCPVIGSIESLSDTYSTASVIPEPMYFNSSLLVEYASSLTETNKTNIAYKYYAR